MMKLRIMLLSLVIASMLIILPSVHAQKIEQKAQPGFPAARVEIRRRYTSQKIGPQIRKMQ